MPDINIVIVDALGSLQNYYNRLSVLKEEVRVRGRILKSLSSNVKKTALTMGRITSAQGNNWQDPQYDKLEDAVSRCVDCVKCEADSLDEAAAVIENTITQIDASLSYLNAQIQKIKNI